MFSEKLRHVANTYLKTVCIVCNNFLFVFFLAVWEFLVPCIKQRSKSSSSEIVCNRRKKKATKFRNEETYTHFDERCKRYEAQLEEERHQHYRDIHKPSIEQENVWREIEAKKSPSNVQLYSTCLEPEQGLPEEETADNIGNEKKCSLDQYRTVTFLGEGGYGNVMLVKRVSASCPCCKQDLFAMKAVRKDVISKDVGSRRIVEKEVFMHAVGHPFLVQLHSYFETKETHYYVMDYMSGGTMSFKLLQEKFLSEELAGLYAAELTLAVEYLHTKGIVHRWPSLTFAART